MRRSLVAPALLALVGSALGACSSDSGSDGGGSSAPSLAEFCGAVKDFQAATDKADTSDVPSYVKALKAAADRLDAVGVPDAMPSDAQSGFTVTITRITALPDQATEDDLAEIGDVDGSQQPQLDALNDYIKKNCPDL